MEHCIDKCIACYRICMQTVSKLYDTEGHNHDLLRQLQVCARACQLSAETMILDSFQHPLTCALCAMLCEQCSVVCRETAEGHERLQFLIKCADICDECAKSCRDMSIYVP